MGGTLEEVDGSWTRRVESSARRVGAEGQSDSKGSAGRTKVGLAFSDFLNSSRVGDESWRDRIESEEVGAKSCSKFFHRRRPSTYHILPHFEYRLSMKRQRRSSSPTPPTPHPAIKSLKKSIALLATLDLPEPQFNALLESLTAVHEDLTAGPGDDMEGDDAGRVARVPVPRPNNWDWSAVIGAGRLERTILEDFRAGKELMDTVVCESI